MGATPFDEAGFFSAITDSGARAMTKRLVPPPPEEVAAIRAESERRLTVEEFEAYVNAPMSDREREEADSLIAWFCRRYPTPAERLAYARRAYARWRRALPPASTDTCSG